MTIGLVALLAYALTSGLVLRQDRLDLRRTGPAMLENQPEAFPAGTGDILEESIQVYRKLFWRVILVSVVLRIPLAISKIVTPILTSRLDTAHLFGFSFLQMLTGQITLEALNSAIVAALVAQVYAPRGISLRAAVSSVRLRLTSLLVTNLQACVWMFVGVLAFLIPGIWWSMVFAFVTPVVLFENIGGPAALARSKQIYLSAPGKAFWTWCGVGSISLEPTESRS
jgi:hypothetical protein